MPSKCPYCRSPLVDDAGFCQMCGVEVRSTRVYRRLAAPRTPTPPPSKNEGLIIVLVVLLVVFIIGGGLMFFAYLGATNSGSAAHSGKLTVTVSNSSIYSDREYSIYFDGEFDFEDVIEAGYVVTLTYNMTWAGPAPVRSISVVWAGGSQTQNVQLVEDSVVSVSFTL